MLCRYWHSLLEDDEPYRTLPYMHMSAAAISAVPPPEAGGLVDLLRSTSFGSSSVAAPGSTAMMPWLRYREPGHDVQGSPAMREPLLLTVRAQTRSVLLRALPGK